MKTVFRYLFIRIFSFLPALLVGILLLFFFRQLGPGTSRWEEQIEEQAQLQGGFDRKTLEDAKAAVRRRLQLDLPVFYFSLGWLGTAGDAAGLLPHELAWVRKVSALSGRADKVKALARYLGEAEADDWDTTGTLVQLLERQRTHLEAAGAATPEILSLLDEIERDASPAAAYVPSLRWHGTQNQFHLWLVNILQADLGRSWKNNEAVSQVLGRAVTNSLKFTLPAFLLIFVSAYWLVIGLSVLSPRVKHWIDQLLYFIDLVPLFAWSLLLMIVFASGLVLSWFPSFVSGAQLTANGFWGKNVWPYVLPVLSLWLAAVPYVTKHIDQAFRKTARQPFVIVAFARGLSSATVKEKYRLRYSLLPAITLFGEYMLAVLSGALVVEVLFSINGIGKLMADSVLTQDFPVVTGIILLLMLARMFSYLLVDLLYYWLDPRTRLGI